MDWTGSGFAVMQGGSAPRAIVAIPACNEEDRIAGCLASLALQRHPSGLPLPRDVFAVLVLANNCTDATVSVASALASSLPYPLIVQHRRLPPAESNAGCARRTAMEHAADLLDGYPGAVILSTDADSTVAPTWVSNSLAAIDAGVDAVMGYVDGQPRELVALGADFLRRGWLEDTYLTAVAETYGRCDPLPHDPWPNHRVASGASIALTVRAYRAIGGLPAKALGEDAALRALLLAHGLKVRHALDVTVTTSCRLDGRAAGGAADTMRARHLDPDAPCDPDMERARGIVRRAAWKGRLRAWHARLDRLWPAAWERRTGVISAAALALAAGHATFEPFWAEFQSLSPLLAPGPTLRPSDLPVEIAVAQGALRRLRAGGISSREAASRLPSELSVPVWVANALQGNGGRLAPDGLDS